MKLLIHSTFPSSFFPLPSSSSLLSHISACSARYVINPQPRRTTPDEIQLFDRSPTTFLILFVPPRNCFVDPAHRSSWRKRRRTRCWRRNCFPSIGIDNLRKRYWRGSLLRPKCVIILCWRRNTENWDLSKLGCSGQEGFARHAGNLSSSPSIDRD